MRHIGDYQLFHFNHDFFSSLPIQLFFTKNNYSQIMKLLIIRSRTSVPEVYSKTKYSSSNIFFCFRSCLSYKCVRLSGSHILFRSSCLAHRRVWYTTSCRKRLAQFYISAHYNITNTDSTKLYAILEFS